MSIIYDALKKVEKLSLPQQPETQNTRRSKVKVYLLYFLLVCAGVFIASIFFKFLAGLSTETKTASLPPARTPQPALPQAAPPVAEPPVHLPVLANTSKQPSPELKLNGVFFSQDQGYALINNRIVKEGDMLEGARVKQITLKEVELDFQGSVIKLTSK